MLPLMRHLGATPLVLAGDHKQLPAFSSTPEGKKAAGNSLFQVAHESKRIPSIMLDVNYRSHERIAAAPYRLIYGVEEDGTPNVTAFFNDTNKREFLQNLEKSFPLSVVAQDRQYDVKSCLQFLNVAHGVELTEGVSKCNVAEGNHQNLLVE